MSSSDLPPAYLNSPSTDPQPPSNEWIELWERVSYVDGEWLSEAYDDKHLF